MTSVMVVALLALSHVDFRYHEMYMKVKGNVFKNKRVLMESIHKAKNDRIREKMLQDQQEIRHQRNKEKRARRAARVRERRAKGIFGPLQEQPVVETGKAKATK